MIVEEDPFAPTLEALRKSAVGCFAPLPAGEFASTLVLRVSPAGRVTRVDLEAGNVEDAEVQTCLRKLGAATSFPASKGREVRVQVRVKG